MINISSFRLVSKRQLDASISHYIEGGKTTKALDAAVGAKQWRKAVQVHIQKYLQFSHLFYKVK